MGKTMIIALSTIMIIAWVVTLLLIRWTIHANQNQREKIQKVLRKAVFYSGVVWWMGQPEKEKDPEKRAIRMKKLRNQVGSVAVEFGIIAFVLLGLGISAALDSIYDISLFMMLVLAPFAGLYACYLGLLWHLLKNNEVDI